MEWQIPDSDLFIHLNLLNGMTDSWLRPVQTLSLLNGMADSWLRPVQTLNLLNGVTDSRQLLGIIENLSWTFLLTHMLEQYRCMFSILKPELYK